MITDQVIAEKRFVDMKADEYRRQGYAVSREEVLDTVPGFQADLVVRKDGHTKVVEVRTQSSLASDQRLDDVATVVNGTPGWSFELHLLADPEQRRAPPMAHDLEEAGIFQRLRTAQQLMNDGIVEPAFLIAWAATEAAIRTLIAARGIIIDSITSPTYLLNQAAFHNAIYTEEYDYLQRLSTYRNAIVHGLQAVDLDQDMVSDLIAIASRFLKSAQLTSNFTARVNALRALRDGWLVGTGSAPSEEGLEWLNASFTETFGLDAVLPFVEATPSGGVQLVWPIGHKAINLDIDLHNRAGRLFEYDRLSDTWNERELDLNDHQNWQWLLMELRHIGEEQTTEISN